MNNAQLLTVRNGINRLWRLEEAVPEYKIISQGINHFEDTIQGVEDGLADYRDVEMYMSRTIHRLVELGVDMANYSDLLDYALVEQKEDGQYITDRHWTAKCYIYHNALLEVCENNPRYHLYLYARTLLYKAEVQAKDGDLSAEDIALTCVMISQSLYQLELFAGLRDED